MLEFHSGYKRVRINGSLVRQAHLAGEGIASRDKLANGLAAKLAQLLKSTAVEVG
jgi:hypothetical protein